MGIGDLVRAISGVSVAISRVLSDNFGNLLVCPNCRTLRSLGVGKTRVECSNCGASFEVKNDIIDFVSGRSDTALDVNKYDEQKKVSFDHSVALFRHIKNIANGLIRDNLGTALEIGGGTGLLTLGMIAESEFDRAVITDISPAMLAICGGRLDQLVSPVKRERVVLATYSGQENIFGYEQYDLCIANSVLHHVLDYAGLLANLRKATKPSGTVIFIEPGATFHETATLAMAEAVVSLMAQGISFDRLRSVCEWIEQTQFRLRSKPSEFAHLEDKHIFSREDVAEKATQAGFGSLSIVPFNHDPCGHGAVNNYLRELGVPAETAEIFMRAYRQPAEYQFRNVAREDMSAMYLFAFRRSSCPD